MSKASGKTVHRVIAYTEQDKFAIYFQVYSLPSHLMKVGGKGEKLGDNPSRCPPIKVALYQLLSQKD